MTKSLYLIRHCEPLVVNGRKQGLTKNGIHQATGLGLTLAAELYGETSLSVHHSPVERCRETAQIIGKHLHVSTKEAPLRLRNADNLKLEGTQSKLSKYLSRFNELAIESPEDFTSRICQYLHKQPEESLLLVGNEVPLRLLLREILGEESDRPLPHGDCIKITIDTAPSVIERTSS